MSGINMISVYASQIFEMIEENGGTSSFSVVTQSYSIGLISFFGTILSVFSIRSFGRRPLFLVGIAIMGSAHALIAYYIINKDADLVLFFMSIQFISYQVSIGSGYYVYCSEISNEFAIGIAIGIMQCVVMLQSLTVGFIAESYGVETVFICLGAW